MLSIERNKESNIYIKGDFWSFDRLYFAVSKFVGDFGIDTPFAFPGYEDVCESLLGLNYELRKSMEGKRELHIQYSGIPETWFDDYPENNKKGILDWVTDEEQYNDDGFDIDDEDEIDDESEEYVYAYFSKSDYPEASQSNTWLQTEISFAEALYYAFIIRELLEKVDQYKKIRKEMAESNNIDFKELNIEYYYCQMRTDIARITIYMEEVFRSLYHFIGSKSYITFMGKLESTPDGILNCDLMKCNDLTVKYAKLGTGDNAKSRLLEFLDSMNNEFSKNS